MVNPYIRFCRLSRPVLCLDCMLYNCFRQAQSARIACLQVKLNASGVAHDGFRKRMRALVDEVKARGEPEQDDQSIAGLLLKLRNPQTGDCACWCSLSLYADWASEYSGRTRNEALNRGAVPAQERGCQTTGLQLSLQSCTRVAQRQLPSQPPGPCEESLHLTAFVSSPLHLKEIV